MTGWKGVSGRMGVDSWEWTIWTKAEQIGMYPYIWVSGWCEWTAGSDSWLDGCELTTRWTTVNVRLGDGSDRMGGLLDLHSWEWMSGLTAGS